MTRTPILIIIALFLLAFFGIWQALNIPESDLDRLNSIISIAACLGAFVAAVTIIFSYVQTNFAFIESQRPQLLILLENAKMKESDETLTPAFKIHYRNITKNMFKDLTIRMSINADNGKIEADLSYLFTPKMTMIGGDARQRSVSHSALAKSGVDIERISSDGSNEILLRISYTYTFQGRENEVVAQHYRWDSQRQTWEIH